MSIDFLKNFCYNYYIKGNEKSTIATAKKNLKKIKKVLDKPLRT
jgi:hypothetical protein